ncbi:hypothetical protein ABIF66_002947 [Bradyrhizobium japonicum]
MIPPKPEPFRLEKGASLKKQREHDRRMFNWLAGELEEQLSRDLSAAAVHAPSPENYIQQWEDYCISLARRGNPKYLRLLYPAFADCIRSPKNVSGRPPQVQLSVGPAKFAAELAKRIKVMWRNGFGQVNRRLGEKTAQGFAVEIYANWTGVHLTEDEVHAAGKKRGKKISKKSRAK